MRVRLRGDTGTMEWSSDLGPVGTVRLGGDRDFGPPSLFRVEWGILLTAGGAQSVREGGAALGPRLESPH